MKLKIFAVLFALAALAAVSRSARAANDPISGEWDVTFHVEGMATPATFRLALDGGRVSGTAESHHTGPGTVRDGSWKDRPARDDARLRVARVDRDHRQLEGRRAGRRIPNGGAGGQVGSPERIRRASRAAACNDEAPLGNGRAKRKSFEGRRGGRRDPARDRRALPPPFRGDRGERRRTRPRRSPPGRRGTESAPR